jgi:hypothetical protein
MPKRAVWMSYDLGIQGDYQSLYKWLDTQNAKECGDSLALFNFEYSHSLKDELKDVLTQDVSFGKSDRIYIVYRDELRNISKGVFLFGGRREAPWTGHAEKDSGAIDEEVG